MRRKMFFRSLLLVVFLATATASPAQGLFKNLGKKVGDAVKGTVKSTAELMVGDEGTIKKREKEAKEQAQKEAKKQQQTTQASTADEGHGPGAGSWSSVPQVLIDFDGFCWECVSPSCDGVFTVQVGDENLFRFYATEGGSRISQQDWMFLSSSSMPLFDKGVCAVKSKETRKWFILKQDGSTIALDPKITAVGNFHDGLAVAEINYQKHFINTQGKIVQPTIELENFNSYPLVDGTRRLFQTTKGYGYLDGHNNVVIQPQFNKATNFSGGYALVLEDMWDSSKNDFWVINEFGKKIAKVPNQYILSSYIDKTAYVTGFIGGGAVAKNFETEKYDIVSPQMQVKAIYDDASPFCLKKFPANASVCVVKNDDWKYPAFCLPNGEIVRNYADPMVSIAGPTRPYYVRKNDKGEETVMLPPLLSSYHHTDLVSAHPENAWKTTDWEYTGYTVLGGSLVTDLGYIMNYEGILRLLNWRYEKISSFSTDGFAKAIKKSTRGWRKQVSTWIEELDDHMCFLDENGKVAVEIVVKE